MNIVNKSLTIDVNLTNDVWNRVIKVTKNHDDISLIVKNVNVDISKLVIPESISSVDLKCCKFNEPVEISGLDKGRFFGMDNCKKNFILGNVTLSNLNCRTFSFIEEPSTIKSDEEESLTEINISPFIQNCAFHNVNYQSLSCPEFINVTFINKFKYRSISDDESKSLFFGRCKFVSGLKIEIMDVSELDLVIKHSLVVNADDDFGNVGLVVSKNTIINNINIENSRLKGFDIYFFKKRIHNIDIKDSVLGILEFYTASDDEDNYIYNVDINGSEVYKLYLRYKNIVHRMSFINTTFYNPPELLGANIPIGSVFPKKEYFKSRKGTSDASCYRNIRFAMESQRDRDLEGMFFSLEQESILNEKEGLGKYFSLSYLYLAISNYGTNYTRPLLILTISIILFSIINSLLSSPVLSPNLPIDWDLVFSSFILTVKQVLQPFSTLKEVSFNIEERESVNYWYVILGVINSLISLGCIALSGLAIRWKFKRG